MHYSSTSSDSSRVFNTEMQSVMDKVFNKVDIFSFDVKILPVILIHEAYAKAVMRQTTVVTVG